MFNYYSNTARFVLLSKTLSVLLLTTKNSLSGRLLLMLKHYSFPEVVTFSSSPRYKKKLFSQGCRALLLTIKKTALLFSSSLFRCHSFPILLSTILVVSSFSPHNTSLKVSRSLLLRIKTFLFPRVCFAVPSHHKNIIAFRNL